MKSENIGAPALEPQVLPPALPVTAKNGSVVTIDHPRRRAKVR